MRIGGVCGRRLLVVVALAGIGASAAAEAVAAESPPASSEPAGRSEQRHGELVILPQVLEGLHDGGVTTAGSKAVAVVPAAVRAALSTSDAGLREQELRGPKGGVVLHLQGRFLSAVVAGKDANGRLVMTCTEGSAAAESAEPAAARKEKP